MSIREKLIRGRKRQRECENDDFEQKYGSSKKPSNNTNITEVNKKLDAIKCYFRMLIGSNADGYELDSDCEQLLERLQISRNSLKQMKIPLNVYFKNGVILAAVIRECFLSFCWTDAFRVLESTLSYPSVKNIMTIRRICFELYYRLSFPLLQLDSLTSKFNLLSGCQIKQNCIDEFLFRIATLPRKFEWGEVLNGLDGSLTADVEKSMPHAIKTKWHAVTENCIFPGYRAMLLYLKFLRNEQECSKTEEPSTAGSKQFTQSLSCQFVEQAVRAFKEFEANCQMEPDCWDIFISKYIDLLQNQAASSQNGEKYLEKADSILKQNANQNMFNQSAWRFLYDFYSHHSYDVKEHVKILQELCNCVPSDKLTLKLCELKLKGDFSAGRECDPVYLLFNHLDYNLGDSSAWGMFAQIFVTHLSQSQDTENYSRFTQSVKDCWIVQNRNSWWPAYQFSLQFEKLANLSKEDHETFSFKAVVALCLLGAKNKFTVSVKHAMRRMKIKHEGTELLRQAKHLPEISWVLIDCNNSFSC